PIVAALVPAGAARPVRFGVQERVERLLHRSPNHLVHMRPHSLTIDAERALERSRAFDRSICYAVHQALLSVKGFSTTNTFQREGSLFKCAHRSGRYLPQESLMLFDS